MAGKRRASRSSCRAIRLDPVCGTNLGGVANTDPSLSGIFSGGAGSITSARCELTGEPLYSGFTRDPNLAGRRSDALQLNAFRRPMPNGAVGNFGNAPLGVLRHPGCSNWDFTLARRVRLGGRANLRVQLQVYNLFNQVEFIALNAELPVRRDGKYFGRIRASTP